MAAASSSAVPAAARLKELPRVWITSLARVLAGADAPLVRQIALVVRTTSGGKVAAELEEALLSIARDGARPLETRLDALAVIQSSAPIDQTLFDVIRTGLAASSPGAARSAAASIVANARFDRQQLMALVPLLEAARPIDLPRILQAFDGGSAQGAAAPDEELGLAVVQALGRSSARSAIRADILRQRLERYPDSVRKAGEALLTSIHEDSDVQAARLTALLAAAQGGDVARGQTVFNGTKGACLSCHAIGYIGGRIGPDLTRIGQVRSERDLVEAIAFPSVSFARGYEPVVVRTRSGEERGGSLVGDADSEVVLSDVAGNEIRIPRADITDMQPGTVSLMPAGFGDVLTSQELADLVAFLKAAR
jgi:putative heme-binding domain-containing protein